MMCASPQESFGVVRKTMLKTLLSSLFAMSMIRAPLFTCSRIYPSDPISESVSFLINRYVSGIWNLI